MCLTKLEPKIYSNLRVGSTRICFLKGSRRKIPGTAKLLIQSRLRMEAQPHFTNIVKQVKNKTIKSRIEIKAIK